MKQEDKELLLRYLCMALPYKVKVCLYERETCVLLGIDGYDVYLDVDSDPFRIESIKPYLRTMSSMTEEEMERFTDTHSLLDANGIRNNVCCTVEGMDYLNSINVDYRGLISMDLALEAPEDMYDSQKE